MKPWIKTALAGGVFTLARCDVAMAGPLEDGKAAFERRDYATALQLLRPLAEQGDANAQMMIGDIYQSQSEDAEALRWYHRAADQGNNRAQYDLGNVYEYGRGVSEDYDEALKWYQKAADQGYPGGMVSLSDMYFHGKGVPQNYIYAHMWFNLAVSRYPASNKDGREYAEGGRDSLASKMSPDQIAEAQRLAHEWKPK